MKNLSVQELADELGVSRQLIYYHAKKIKEGEKVYDETNRLVFTPEQQLKLQSFMTLEDDDAEESNDSKESKDVLQDEKTEKESLGSAEATAVVKEVTVQIDHPEQLSFTMDSKDELKEETDEKETPKEEVDETSNESEDEESDHTKSDEEENLVKEQDDEEKKTSEPEMNENVTDFIRTYVRKYMDQDDDPAQTMEQYFKVLEQQLYEKDLHIDRLAKLLDQQQQLLLVEQQKNIQLRLEYSNMSHTQESKEIHNRKINDSQGEKETSSNSPSTTQSETTASSQTNTNEPSPINSKPPKKWWQFWK